MAAPYRKAVSLAEVGEANVLSLLGCDEKVGAYPAEVRMVEPYPVAVLREWWGIPGCDGKGSSYPAGFAVGKAAASRLWHLLRLRIPIMPVLVYRRGNQADPDLAYQVGIPSGMPGLGKSAGLRGKEVGPPGLPAFLCLFAACRETCLAGQFRLSSLVSLLTEQIIEREQ